jgi:hypothetical protein
MSSLSVEVVVPSFGGAWRLERLLESVSLHDMAAREVPWTVYEDPSTLQMSAQYERVCEKFGVRYVKLPTWSNMHGAAQYAFQHATADWVYYLGDDVLVTPLAISSAINWVRHSHPQTVALVQPSYWNAHDLSVDGYDGSFSFIAHGENKVVNGRPILLTIKEDMYTLDPSWLAQVPRNPHWDGEGIARPYINVNGVGFLCNREVWKYVGGFAQLSWCLDESIAWKVWTQTPFGVVCLPGPPLVHFFGGATLSNPPKTDAYKEEMWIEEFGLNKHECGVRMREIMDMRSKAISEEMQEASYV